MSDSGRVLMFLCKSQQSLCVCLEGTGDNIRGRDSQRYGILRIWDTYQCNTLCSRILDDSAWGRKPSVAVAGRWLWKGLSGGWFRPKNVQMKS